MVAEWFNRRKEPGPGRIWEKSKLSEGRYWTRLHTSGGIFGILDVNVSSLAIPISISKINDYLHVLAFSNLCRLSNKDYDAIDAINKLMQKLRLLDEQRYGEDRKILVKVHYPGFYQNGDIGESGTIRFHYSGGEQITDPTVLARTFNRALHISLKPFPISDLNERRSVMSKLKIP